MRVTRFDPAAGAARVRACHAIHQAAGAVDDPAEPPMGERTFGVWLTTGWGTDPAQTWLATSGGEPVGYLRLRLPQRANKHLAGVTVVVHPTRRRTGAATAMVRQAAEQAHEASRALLVAEARESSPGEAFARTAGASQEDVVDVRRVLRLDGSHDMAWAGARRQAATAAVSYTLESWEGKVPEDKLVAVAGVVAAMADAPHNHEPMRPDVAEVRAGQEPIRLAGLRAYAVAARHTDSREMAGLSQVIVAPDSPGWGHTTLTVVSSPHRGHRLGVLLKTALIDLLAQREPQLTHITTMNAESNRHMIAINEMLGFQVVDRWLSWRLPVSQALSLPA